MADLMTKAQISMKSSIIGKTITLNGTEPINYEDQQFAFGRLLWEAAALDECGIIKLGKVDHLSLSFVFTRLSEETFDTDSLYAIKPTVPRYRGDRLPQTSLMPSPSKGV
ncbi:hypothetical protein GCM10011396_23350 [Undibacterium terreum]|uniref:Uncharacterized protein n=2 Tax=Undibacterium terreum TaxID=1224302 RepID=A0A916UJ26_9BURK|nr:hypothetical protein GCM10011396_23350 [Undibacterium terreum]